MCYTDLSIMFLGCSFFPNHTAQASVLICFPFLVVSFLVWHIGIPLRVTLEPPMSPCCVGFRGISLPNTGHDSVAVEL